MFHPSKLQCLNESLQQINRFSMSKELQFKLFCRHYLNYSTFSRVQIQFFQPLIYKQIIKTQLEIYRGKQMHLKEQQYDYLISGSEGTRHGNELKQKKISQFINFIKSTFQNQNKKKASLASLAFLVLLLILFLTSFKREEVQVQQVLISSDDEDPVIRYQNIVDEQDRSEDFAQNYMSLQLIKTLRESRYYDIHYFVDDSHYSNSIRQIHTAKPRNPQDMYDVRPFLNFKQTPKEIQTLIQKMMFPPYRPKQMPSWLIQRNKTLYYNVTFFDYQLNLHPEREDYLEAQFYRLDKLYDIGKYGNQLPLCVVLVGKNTAKVVDRCYDSIRKQNYTNYRIIHFDDSSYDGTMEKVIDYLRDKPDMRDRFTVITQKYHNNALKNRHIGTMKYCQDGEIVVDMDSDDWLIGNQVFQLINTVYQKGNMYKGEKYDVWQAYTTNIAFWYIPFIAETGQIPQKIFDNQRYMGYWRTTEVRTFLWKFYEKIDVNDMIDPIMPRGEFYTEAYDNYMHLGMLEMGGPQHLVLLDEPNYYYTGSPPRDKHPEVFYCQAIAKTMRGYQRIKTLDDKPQRMTQFYPQQKRVLSIPEKRNQVVKKINNLKNKTLELYQKGKMRVKEIQKRIVIRKIFQNATFGELQYLGLNASKIKTNKIQNFAYNQTDLENKILITSNYDYFGLNKEINLTRLERRLIKSIAHEVLTFDTKKLIKKEEDKIQYAYFKKESKAQKFIENMEKQIELEISINMAKDATNEEYQELEYFYANKIYNISKISKQLPFCIFSSGQRAFERNEYWGLLNSLEMLNYSNFRIVYVNDYASDGDDAYKIYERLKNSTIRIKDKITIINNLQHLGSLANMHLMVKTYCQKGDIVLIIDSEDRLIGRQALKVLNSVYQNEDVWYVHSNYLQYTSNKNYEKTSSVQAFQTHDLRKSLQKFNPHLVSFRKQVLDAVSIQQFLQYTYVGESGMAYPRYLQSTSSSILAISLMEICGKEKIKHLPEFLAVNVPKVNEKCSQLKESVDQLKFKMKYPQKPLKSFEEIPQMETNSPVSDEHLKKLKQKLGKLAQCLKQQKPTVTV